MTPGLLIVGGGLAAQRCCETLRALGHDGPVTVLGPERPYDRPPLSKDMPAEPPWLRPFEWYAEHEVVLLEGTAERLNAGRRIVVLRGGERVRYDELVIATGSAPVRLPALAGLDHVQALRTHADSLRLRAALAAGARLAVVGGGLIGLEVASAARAVGAEVTVIEAAPQLLPRLGPEVGARLAALHRAEGTRVLLGSPLDRAEGAGRRRIDGGPTARVEALVLADGTRVEADHVVEAVGVRPASGWFAGAALDRHVYLAGDVTGSGHWEAAARQGAGVARALLGLPPAPEAPPSFWSDQLGLRLHCVGDPAGTRAELTVDAGGFDAVYRRAGAVTAVLLAGRSAADLRAARRRLSPAPELERSAA
jgi:NADPH-dependent 2,4-dienoyl-CoA reductase/sulfur reductase-like enzyme